MPALIDIALIWTLAVMLAELLLPPGRLLRVQSIATLILSLLDGLLGIGLMVSLPVAVPFGTAAYVAAWGNFLIGDAGVALVMVLKLSGRPVWCWPLPRSCAILGCWFCCWSDRRDLGGGIMASIADVVGALISAVLGTIGLFVMLVRAIRPMVPG